MFTFSLLHGLSSRGTVRELLCQEEIFHLQTRVKMKICVVSAVCGWKREEPWSGAHFFLLLFCDTRKYCYLCARFIEST